MGFSEWHIFVNFVTPYTAQNLKVSEKSRVTLVRSSQHAAKSKVSHKKIPLKKQQFRNSSRAHNAVPRLKCIPVLLAPFELFHLIC